jgi:hypothetical protein
MSEEKKFLSLLQVAVPAETPLTVPSEMRILQMLGIVSNHELLQTMEMATALIPASTPATLHGLVTFLSGLVRKHPKATKEHHDELGKVLKDFNSVPDAQLTFGTFLPICENLMNAKEQSQRKHEHIRSREK